MPGKEGRKWSERKSEQCETLQSCFPILPHPPLALGSSILDPVAREKLSKEVSLPVEKNGGGGEESRRVGRYAPVLRETGKEKAKRRTGFLTLELL